MNHQTNRNGCACGKETRSGNCTYGRTPWGTREACNSCRRPWNTHASRGTCGEARSSCPCAANTVWKNRGEGCACATPRTACSCGTPAVIDTCIESPREVRNTCSCATPRDGDCDENCNRGAVNTGVLDGKSLAMVYSPYQRFDALYDPRKGLCQGTIFTGLDKPFHGDGRGC